MYFFQYREKEAIRLCLKHFRQQNYTDAYNVLADCTKIKLEDPLLTRLHATLVKEGDFDSCERIIDQAAQGMAIL